MTAEYKKKSDSVTDFSFTTEISIQTLVRILIKKGIITVDEVITEECRNRSSSLYSTHSNAKHKNHSRFSWLKKRAARHRWSRRLTSRLFGWEWKKVKVRSTKSEEASE